MRSSSSVCLLCRLQVAKAASKTRAVRWQTQTAQRSTTSSRLDAAGAGTATSYNATIAASGGPPSPPNIRKTVSPKPRSKSNVQMSQTKITGEPPSSRVDTLFQQIIQEQQGLQDPAGDASFSKSGSVNLSLVKAIGRLQEMVATDTSVVDAYLYFQAEVHPAVQEPQVPQAYRTVTSELLKRLVAAKKADMRAEELPTVADIFRRYAEIGELNPKQWTLLVGELVQCIIDINPSTKKCSVAEYERQLTLREAMLSDLIESWKVLSSPQLNTLPAHESLLANDFWFPKLDRRFLIKCAKAHNFSAAFSTLFPHYPPNLLGQPVAMLAIATYTLMHDSKRCSVVIRQSAKHFMSKVGCVVTFVKYRDKDLRKALAKTFPGLEDYVMGLWPKIRAYLQLKPVDEDEGSAEFDRIFGSGNETEKTLAFDAGTIGRSLIAASGNRNSAQLDILWEEFVGLEETISDERAAQIRKHPELIDSFIKTRMMFKQPDKAILAWNVLGKVGLKPSLRTWNLMLDGLRKAGNLDGIKNIWAKLSKSGMQLDTEIWTTRIAGLIDCGDIEGGLHALEEMTARWGNGTNKTAVMPTIAPVNAALFGLIRRQRHDIAEKLLAWAGRKGIQPDVFTFNTLLRSLIRNGNQSKDVEKMLDTMRAQGVSPDEATFVIILDASFSQNEVRDPEEQANIVADIASAMTNAGLELNMQTYGKMIYTLLCSKAITAAMAVVNHMYKRKLELSTHIYTMLVEYCFAQNPPALDSVHLLVKRRLHLDPDDMEHIFYDRVVRGYALVGETKAALDIYNRLIPAGGRVAMSALIELLRALIRQDNFEDARALVNLEKKHFEDRNPNPEGHASYWSHQFWQIAETHNLLDSALPPLGVPSAGPEANDSAMASQSC